MLLTCHFEAHKSRPREKVLDNENEGMVAFAGMIGWINSESAAWD